MAKTAGGKRGVQASWAALVARLDPAQVAALLVSAAQTHEDVGRAVQLAAADDTERVQVLQAAVDRGLRTSRYLDYREASMGELRP